MLRKSMAMGIMPSTLAMAMLLGLCTPAEAAYRPEMKVSLKGKNKSLLREALAAFNALPDIGRQAIIANRLELYFSEEGDSRYNSWDHCPNSGAKFVDSDGNIRDWRQVKDSIPPVQWNDADRKVYDLGANAVFPSVAKEVTPLIYETAKAVVNSMPPELRDSWLAEEAGLLYTPSGTKAYAKGYTTTTTDSGKEVKSKKLTSLYDLRFKDAEGEEHQYAKVLADHAQKYERRRKVLYLCIQYTSRKEILDLFADEVSALKRARTKTKDAASTSSVASDSNRSTKTSDTTTPSDTTATADTPSTASGATADTPSTASVATADQASPQTDTTPAAEPVRKPIRTSIPTTPPPLAPVSDSDSPVVAMLKKVPQPGREAKLAAMLGICFMENGSSATNSIFYVRGASQFIGTDGKKYSFGAEQRAVYQHWSVLSGADGSFEEKLAVYQAMPEVVTQLLLQNAAYHLNSMPELVRDAWITELSGLYYIENGTESAYTGGTDTTPMANGFALPYKSVRGGALFRDTKGVVHRWQERQAYWDTWMWRWNICQFCAAMLGIDKVLDACVPDVAATLRKQSPEATKFPFEPLKPLLGSDKEAIDYLRELPDNRRNAWLCEAMGFCFMKDGSSSVDERNWIKRGALYIDPNGKEHDFWTDLNGVIWNKVNAMLPYGKQIVLTKMTKETEELALASIKYHLLHMPPLMRDAWLCIFGGLCYMDGSDADPFENAPSEFRTDKGNSYKIKRIRGNASFVDTKGEKHLMTDRQPYWNECAKPWDIAVVCLKYCDVSKVLESFSAEMAILRKNYEATTGRKAPGAESEPAAEKSSSSSSSSGSRKTGMGTKWF